MTRPYKDLSNLDNRKMWTRMLDKAKAKQGTGELTEYEEDFVTKVASLTDSELWNPSLKQWNFLHTLVN